MASRFIYLVRHGQYHYQDSKSEHYGSLTKLGKKQAVYSCRRLKEVEFSEIYCSDMTRAIETSEIITEQLGYESAQQCDLLREGIPSFPEHLAKKHKNFQKENE